MLLEIKSDLRTTAQKNSEARRWQILHIQVWADSFFVEVIPESKAVHLY